ncbi:MAG: hypothetical protein K5886_00115 [Lachnospiraceae bacterium]|nr:hypothetical protein [Lachnospiraceae bacterium]
MNALNILLIIIWGLVIPFFAGMIPSYLLSGGKVKNVSISENFMFGFLMYLAVFYVPAFPMIMLKLPFVYLKITWILFILLLFFFSLWLTFKDGPEKFFSSFVRTGGENVLYIFAAAVLLIFSQTLLPGLRMHMDTDDSRFIAEALETFEKGTMLSYNPITGEYLDAPVGEMLKDLSSPYPIFVALLSCLFRLHPAITAHTVLPFLLIPLSYVTVYNVFKLFLKKDAVSLGLALIFSALINFFYFGSKSSAGYVLLEIIWQGRSIGAMIMIPAAWYALLRLLQDEEFYFGHYFLLFISGLSAILLSGTTAMQFMFLAAAFLPVLLIKRKSPGPAAGVIIACIPCVIGLIKYYIFK